MTRRLADKVAIVTGAGSIAPGWGNGKATAVLFAREGARVLAVDIDRAAAKETVAIITGEGGDATVCVADVTAADQVQAMIESCRVTYGQINILHNNVGILAPGGVVEQSEADWDRVVAVNLKSMFLTCKYAIPEMVAQGGGSIINLSSISGLRYLGIDYVSYPTTKAAIIQFTRVTAAQYGPFGIRCNAILPGFVRTPMVEATVVDVFKGEIADDPDARAAAIDEYLAKRTAAIPLGYWGDAWDIARAALFLASDEARYITGIELVVDGGVTQVMA